MFDKLILNRKDVHRTIGYSSLIEQDNDDGVLELKKTINHFSS